RDAITVEDALTMRMGTQWDETIPYSDPKNSEIAMENSADRYRYVLEQPMVEDPGTVWNYSGGATTLIGKLIANGAGMPLEDYAKAMLFEPLNISRYEWMGFSEPAAASGLRLTARDLAKIGEIVVGGGVYDGSRIVSAETLAAMLEPQVTVGDAFRYGWQWYLLGPGNPAPLAAGFGNGGQRLSINAKRGLVTVIYAGRYNDFEAWQLALKVVEAFIVPALETEGG
ncbi:MAG: serine hydrolase, partial [Pseudomonadota bacterium]